MIMGMPMNHSLWTVEHEPKKLSRSVLESELQLHKMIEATPSILSDEWMLIGSEQPALGGRFDLLALTPDASLVLIELKKDKTPREVVAQALDYASWVDTLTAEDIAEIYSRFKEGGDLAADFRAHFGQTLDEDELNNTHQIVLVAGQLDASSERIVQYLADRGISINVIFFQVFEEGDRKLLSRAWLVDPAETQSAAASTTKGPKVPWNGEYYVNFGADTSRSWTDARQYGFVSAGGGSWYSRTLGQLEVGDRIWVRIPAKGYVGVGYVTSASVPITDFTVAGPDGQEIPLSEAATQVAYDTYGEDPEDFEYFVGVEWADTVDEDDAVNFVGIFGNQNTVAAPRSAKWPTTVEKLKQYFPQWDQRPQSE